MRFFDLTMALLFAFAAALQYNDPDPLPWVAIYLVAALLSAAHALGRRLPRRVHAAVGVVAIGWAALIALGGPGASEYGYMFDAWEMKSLAVEQAREASGLLIVAVWMAVLFIRTGRRGSVVNA